MGSTHFVSLHIALAMSSSSVILPSSLQFTCHVGDLQKPQGPILTGVGFLNHMIDQFNSHAQIGVSLQQANNGTTLEHAQDNDVEVMKQQENTYADLSLDDQKELLKLVGSELGSQLKLLLAATPSCGTASHFSCPLDEALVACELTTTTATKPAQEEDRKEVLSTGSLASFALAPYGCFPRRSGRSRVGGLRTHALESFWEGLAGSSGLNIRLEKLRGKNAHHIIESAFKAFCRALRNLLDGIDTTECDYQHHDEATAVSLSSAAAPTPLDRLFGVSSDNWNEGASQNRQGSVQRKTKETSIDVSLRLSCVPSHDHVQVSTGITTLDSFFNALAQHADMELHVICQGDLWIDDHHTAEDVSIAIGQALTQALGSKAGLVRMWCATATVGSSTIQVVMDLSNRPCFTHNLQSLEAGHSERGEDGENDEMIGDLSIEMLEHVLDSLVVNARMTVHILEVQASSNLKDVLQAIAIAFGRALKYCAMVDVRRCGATASSKGTLSV